MIEMMSKPFLGENRSIQGTSGLGQICKAILNLLPRGHKETQKPSTQAGFHAFLALLASRGRRHRGAAWCLLGESREVGSSWLV